MFLHIQHKVKNVGYAMITELSLVTLIEDFSKGRTLTLSFYSVVTLHR